MPFDIGANRKRLLLVLTELLLISLIIPALRVFTVSAQNMGSGLAGELIRSPRDVYSRQTVLIFAHISPIALGEVELEVSVTLDASLEPSIIDLPSLPTVTYTLPMLPVPWASGWYLAAIMGLPAKTRIFEYKPLIGPSKILTFTISSRVNYKLLVNGNVVAEDGYEVLEGEVTRRLPPLVVTMVYNALRDPSLIKETLGLGPKGWVIGAGEPLKALIVALDDKGVEGIASLTFEYKVDEGSWIQTSISKDALMRSEEEFTKAVNSLIQKIAGVVRKIKPDFEIPEASLPAVIANAEIAGQNPGAYVMFRANATDVDGNVSPSPMGFYYVVNRGSSTKILVVDPHVWLWLLQENLRQLADMVRQNIDYQVPEDVMNSSVAVSRVSDVIKKHGVEPFHHWEHLGKHYDLYIAWPNEKLASLMKTKEEGGYEPDVIMLSNLWFGCNGTGGSHYWNWDLKDVEVDGKPVLEHLIKYVKEKHAGVIATHGTLSDEVVWLGREPEVHYKVGTRGHVGNVPADINILEERTVAALLGMPELALWEILRDKVAEALCTTEETKPIGLAVGSTPLQVPNVPWNGTLRATVEARHVGWTIPEEFTITIPSVYNEFGFRAYTQVGWQLGMPRTVAYAAWRKADEVRPLTRQIYGKLSMLVENLTSKCIPHEILSEAVDRGMEHRLQNFYGSIVGTNITDTSFNLTVIIHELEKTLSVSIDVGRQAYETILQLLPVKIVALSPNCTAAIILHDKYWDPSGYRSVYFSFEVEAAEGEIAETLLVNAVEWSLKWHYKDITDLLGGIVRVPRELATRFNNAFEELPGNPTISKGLILNEEGYAKIKLFTNASELLHILVAHPTSDGVKVEVLEGLARIANITKVTEGLTRVTVEAAETGKVTLGFRFKVSSELVLNPAYASVKQEAVAPPPPAVAKFEVTDLTITPSEIEVGEEVTVSVSVRNVGEAGGAHKVILKINCVVEASKDVTLPAGESTVVVFKVSRNVAGTYEVEANGLTGSFVVKEVAAPPSHVEAWPPYISVAVLAIAISTILALLIKRRK